MFDQETLNLLNQEKHTHKYYNICVEHAEDMSVHVDGEKPTKLLEINRPNEDPKIRQYRLDIWQPITKSLSDKVKNTLNKIFNPRLYRINFPESAEELSDYLLDNYPYYRSIINYLSGTFTEKDLADPNALMVILPESFEVEESQRFKPVPIIYHASQVLDFKDSDYYVLKDDDLIKVFDRNTITYYKKATKKDTWIVVFEYVHNFGTPPCFRLGGTIKGKKHPYYFESFIAGVLPHWNRVITLTSDLDPQYTLHMFMEKWEIAVNDCVTCKGRGYIREVMANTGEEGNITCSNCKGTGKTTSNPYGKYTINADAVEPGAALPTPPFGYVDKNTAIVDKVEERIKKEEERGLAAINLEILNRVGEDQSGIAKTIDRQDADNFVLKYSNHVFEYVLPNMIKITAAWMYMNGEDIEELMPTIVAPKDLSILSLSQLTQEYKDASNSNVSDNYISAIEESIINTKFTNNEKERRKNLAIIRLNPFKNKTIDELLTIRSMGEPDWKIYKSINIIDIVEQAIDQKKDFLYLSLKEQKEITDKIAMNTSGYSVDAPMIDTNNVDVGDVVTAETIDIEAEAKAKLKGSVGGVQGILELQKSVQEGTTQYDAGIQILELIYGFDNKEARKILGQKQKPRPVQPLQNQ